METIILKQENNIATITISRPQALNALSTKVLEELSEALNTVNSDKNIYALIITGDGEKSFVAGADIAEMKDKNVNEASIYGTFGNKVFSQIETMNIPVIAAVNGFALGGGCELAMACDIRIAADNALFGQPEVGLGITPGFGGTQRLARIVPIGIAKELIYGARNIDAQRAYEIGLVNKVVPLAELEATTMKLAKTIARNAPLAVQACKKAINDGIDQNINDAIKVEVKAFSECFASEDQTYGMQCFLDKTKEKTFSNK